MIPLIVFDKKESKIKSCQKSSDRFIFEKDLDIIMIRQYLLSVLVLASDVIACAGHHNHHAMGDRKRQAAPQQPPADWAYEASFNWGRINPSESKGEHV